MTKIQAKAKIQKLLDRYQNLTSQEMLMNEENTKTKFIRPLFEALGWDFEEDVILEDKISRGRVDYSFRIDGKTKFILEAKPIKIDLDNPKHAHQAINYAWLRSVDWAILTDFEGIKVFYPSDGALPIPAFTIKYTDYIEHFDELWLLSKESFEKGEFDEYAERHGHKPTKQKVDKQLSIDLIEWRKQLTKEFISANSEDPIPQDELDEGIQKILDRLIFIRTCEDRGIESENKLRSLYRIWSDRGRKPRNFLAALTNLFDNYQETYNSGLFEYHPCVKWDAESDAFDKIIKELYHFKNGFERDFSAISPDVFGSVYEQYLGYIQMKQGESKDKKKRKSQGIYYTPTFIVEYIVQNTLGKVLKEKSPQEIKKLRILDPACGSGSFLIKAYEYLESYNFDKLNKPKFAKDTKFGQIEQTLINHGKYKELSSAQLNDILRDNIYGVDLDEQAVEIAKLNLLLKATKSKHKLPHLANIKCGNSLIDDPKIAGDKAFNWNEEFPFCHSEQSEESGFDIIIGNPPYGVNLDIAAKRYFQNNYRTTQGNFDSYVFFLEKSENLLNKHGYIGLIIPNTFLTNKFSFKLRRYILDKFKICKIVDLTSKEIFEQATISTIIIILQKESNFKKKQLNNINVISDDFKRNVLIEQSLFFHDPENKFNINTTNKFCDMNHKLEINTESLGNLVEFRTGLVTGNDKRFLGFQKKNSSSKKFLLGRDVGRYNIKWAGRYVLYNPNEMKKNISGRPREKWIFEAKEKLLSQLLTFGMKRRLMLAYDDKQYYVQKNLNIILQKNKNFKLKYILAIMNSTLMDWYFKSNFFDRAIKSMYLQKFPIKKIDLKKQKIFIDLINKLLKINKEFQTINKGTNRWNQLKSEIFHTDKLIDQKVYELYELNIKEIEIIEKGV